MDTRTSEIEPGRWSILAAGVILILAGALLAAEPLWKPGLVPHLWWLVVLMGVVGITSGAGVLLHHSWGRWIGVAFLLTQVVSLALPRFKSPVPFGFWLTLNNDEGGAMFRIGLNVLALIALIVLLGNREWFRQPHPRPR
jgi:hypothetical protein